MRELVDTYDTYVDGIDFYLNIETGETVFLSDNDPDGEEMERYYTFIAQRNR
ncbi:hypothetical protein [Paenibacillus sp. MMS20-IR301]|uniref:hypothetical protein n=1 Tax=Paenibacillus sp. MMS20-IR301 TaxID=2895946 RepID=UPI0028EC524D|nr:hypothetical protein [Paenibacillus sp. MMS20-IR301]WNS40851.1 hypothetical protein LOS79_17515 [Paenibacillus sp. MMS20-IR301]